MLRTTRLGRRQRVGPAGPVRERRGAGVLSAHGSGPFRCLPAAPRPVARPPGMRERRGRWTCARPSGPSSRRTAHQRPAHDRRGVVGAELIPMAFTTGWGSGINAYAVVLVLGLADKIFNLSQIPNALARTDVLIGAGILFAVEMLADKIPYVDSVWDSVHTVVRPAVGATIGTSSATTRHPSMLPSAPRQAASPPSSRTASRPGCGPPSTPPPSPPATSSSAPPRTSRSLESRPSPSRTRGGLQPSPCSCSCSAPSSSTSWPPASAATSVATTPGVSGWGSPRRPSTEGATRRRSHGAPFALEGRAPTNGSSSPSTSRPDPGLVPDGHGSSVTRRRRAHRTSPR